MSQHSVSLTIERAISAAEAAPGLAKEAILGGKIDLRAQPAFPQPAGEPRVAATQTPSPARSGKSRKLLLIGASLLVLAGAGYFGHRYWTVGRFEVSTDDAYVQADNTTIAPKVSGYISAVLVNDNERVKVGQTLARVDDRDFRVALEQAKADVAAAKASIVGKQASLDAQRSIIDGARATINVDQAAVTFAEQDDKRYSSLASTGFGSVQNAQQAASHIAAARAAVARDAAALETATGQIDVLAAQLEEAKAALAHDEAVQSQAELNLSYTSITSPIDGIVGARTLRVGQYVQAGTQLMAVVPTEAAYVVANYKETQLADVRPGQAVDLAIDMFPGVAFKGRVDSIAPTSGQEFALLPPDNATGNFTKVVQRIPVKIVFDAGSLLAGELRPGMSVYPTIETKPLERRTTTALARD